MERVERAVTPNFEAGRRGRAPSAIVVHTTDGSFAGAKAWFASPESGVSAHYLVSLPGDVVQFVDEADTAFHAGMESVPDIAVLGDEPPNLVTIGIEFADDGRPHDVDRPDQQYEAGALLLAGISRRWGIPLDHDHVLAHRRINPNKTCPANLDVDELIELAIAFAEVDDELAAPDPGLPRVVVPRLVVMVPARNAAADLPRFLESVARFADAVVALDDGSTDDTAAMLEAHPLVEVLLRNPRRHTYAGWDDGANRARLLDAARDVGADWVVSLDADEAIAADDGEALRAFVDRDALPGLAYGFEVYRMWGDGCELRPSFAYRLFAPTADSRLPGGRLHFDPVPVDVTPERHVRTSLRIQHWGSVDEAARLARVEKYQEADPEGAYPTGYAGVDDVPEAVVPWSPRPGDLPTIVEGRPRVGAVSSRARPRLVVMVPARNAAADLPGFLESVARFADAVVALDDGSTDDTAAILDAHPLVHTVLRNPRRESYEGWDDAANRNRLLAAAAALEPEWLLSLDADERIPADDAAALVDFLATDALPGCAYGMRCYRMIGDLEHYDVADLWVYRLFASRAGQRFPDTRLHFVPVPDDIPRALWLQTTIRIQHLASITDERRRARFAKYREADPDAEFQATYEHLLRAPDAVLAFAPRSPELPVLVAAEELDVDAPALSAVVISRDDEARIERTVRSVVEQECDDPFEVIVVTSGTDRTAAIVRAKFPTVRLVELDHPALPGEARNAGLRFARGHYVSFPGSHVSLPPGSLAARIRAHDAGWTMVTGTTRNGTDTPAGWAAFFLDHAAALPGRGSEELRVAPGSCSYERRALLAIGGFPDDVRAGEDTAVNQALFGRGYTAYRAADVPLVHHNRCTTPWRLVRHHFGRGRALTQFQRSLAPNNGAQGNARVRRVMRGYLKRRLDRLDADVDRWGADLRSVYRRRRPLVVLGIGAAYAGAWWEYVRPSRRLPTETAAGVSAGVSDVASAGALDAAARSPLVQPLRVRREPVARFVGHRAIFVHIPKTAGSTLDRIIEREYDRAAVLRLYGDLDAGLAALRSRDDADRRALRAVVGHFGMGLGDELPGASAYLTILRDPVERIISHYHYVKARQHDRGHARALEGVRSLEEYVTASAFASIVNDGQARLLGSRIGAAAVPADDATLARALAALDRDDVVVGVQDRFDEFVLLACRAFGWGWPAYRRENVGVARPRAAELPGSTIALIREHNARDVVLYEAARARVARDLARLPDPAGQLETVRLAARWPS